MIENGVFSLWTKPPKFALVRGSMLVASYAIALASETFPRVELVTDDRGAAIAAALGWPCLVRSDLEQLDAPADIWSAGKLEAMRLQRAPFLHIDLDVLLLGRKLPADFLETALCAQSIDYPRPYNQDFTDKHFQIAGLVRGFTPYNAGVIGGNDLETLHAFATSGLEKMRRFEGLEYSGTAAAMYCEQYHFGTIAAERGLQVATLYDMEPKREDLERLQYAHLVGGWKAHPFYVTRAEARFAREFPKLYARFLEGWGSLNGIDKSPWLGCCGAS